MSAGGGQQRRSLSDDDSSSGKSTTIYVTTPTQSSSQSHQEGGCGGGGGGAASAKASSKVMSGRQKQIQAATCVELLNSIIASLKSNKRKFRGDHRVNLLRFIQSIENANKCTLMNVAGHISSFVLINHVINTHRDYLLANDAKICKKLYSLLKAVEDGDGSLASYIKADGGANSSSHKKTDRGTRAPQAIRSRGGGGGGQKIDLKRIKEIIRQMLDQETDEWITKITSRERLYDMIDEWLDRLYERRPELLSLDKISQLYKHISENFNRGYLRSKTKSRGGGGQSSQSRMHDDGGSFMAMDDASRGGGVYRKADGRAAQSSSRDDRFVASHRDQIGGGGGAASQNINLKRVKQIMHMMFDQETAEWTKMDRFKFHSAIDSYLDKLYPELSNITSQEKVAQVYENIIKKRLEEMTIPHRHAREAMRSSPTIDWNRCKEIIHDLFENDPFIASIMDHSVMHREIDRSLDQDAKIWKDSTDITIDNLLRIYNRLRATMLKKLRGKDASQLLSGGGGRLGMFANLAIALDRKKRKSQVHGNGNGSLAVLADLVSQMPPMASAGGMSSIRSGGERKRTKIGGSAQAPDDSVMLESPRQGGGAGGKKSSRSGGGGGGAASRRRRSGTKKNRQSGYDADKEGDSSTQQQDS